MKQIFGTSVWRYVMPATLLVLVVVYLAMAVSLPRDARTMPLLVGTALLLLVPVDLISLTETRLGRFLRERANPAAGEPLENLGGGRTQLTAMAWVLGFGAAMFLVGIILAVPLYIAGSLRFLGGKSWKAATLAAVLVGSGTYLLFQWGLGVDLYSGLFLASY